MFTSHDGVYSHRFCECTLLKDRQSICSWSKIRFVFVCENDCETMVSCTIPGRVIHALRRKPGEPAERVICRITGQYGEGTQSNCSTKSRYGRYFDSSPFLGVLAVASFPDGTAHESDVIAPLRIHCRD